MVRQSWPTSSSRRAATISQVTRTASAVSRPTGLVVSSVAVYSRRAEVLGEWGVGDEQSVLLAAESAVDAGERLHEQGALEGPVEEEGVQGRGVEAGEHHVLDDDEFEVVVHIPEPVLDRLVPRVTTHVAADGFGVGGAARVDDLDEASVVLVGVPVGAQFDDPGVEPRADLAGGADDEGLAVRFRVLAGFGGDEELRHGLAAPFPLLDDVAGQGVDAFRSAVDRVELGHGALDAFAGLVIKSSRLLVGELIEFLDAHVVVESNLDEAGLEVDGNGGAVDDGP